MIALFRQKSPANLMMLLIFGLLIKIPYLLYPQVQPPLPADGVMYQLAATWLADNIYIAALLAFGLLYAQALMINYAVNEHRLTTKHSFLPAMSFMLITSLVAEWNYFSAPLLASILLLWAVLKLFRVYNVETVNGRVFDIGVIVGVAAMFFFPAAAFFLMMLLGLLLLRPFRIREWFLLLLGLLTPFYFYGLYLFLTDKFIIANLVPSLSIDAPAMNQALPLAIAAAFLVMPFLIGSFHIQAQLRKMLIQVRKNWSIVLVYLLLALAVPFISGGGRFYSWVIAMPPFAAFHACAYLYPTKKWVPLVLFWSTVAVVLAQQYGWLQLLMR